MAILKLFYTETGLKSIVLAQRYILMVSHFLKTDRQNLPCMYSPGLHFPLPSPPLNASKYFCMITNPTGQTSVVLTKYPSITTKQPIGFNGFKSHHQLQNNSVDFSRGNSDIIQPYHFSATKKKMFSKHHPGAYQGYSWGLNLGLIGRFLHTQLSPESSAKAAYIHNNMLISKMHALVRVFEV